jgi:hypothetical protein
MLILPRLHFVSNGASDAPPEEYVKPDSDATYVLPKASRL